MSFDVTFSFFPWLSLSSVNMIRVEQLIALPNLYYVTLALPRDLTQLCYETSWNKSCFLMCDICWAITLFFSVVCHKMLSYSLFHSLTTYCDCVPDEQIIPTMY